MLQLEIPIETCLAAATLAHGARAHVVLNAAPPPKPGATGLTDLLRCTDVLVVNETEALSMADTDKDIDTGTGTETAPADRIQWIELARRLRARGPGACVVTLGGAGAVAHDGTRGWAQPAFPADVVDTTGAGDAFCGVLAAALAAGADLPEAVRQGCAAGAFATGGVGAQCGPTRDELERVLDSSQV